MGFLRKNGAKPRFFLAQKAGFEPALPFSDTTPLAGEPLEPLGYFCNNVHEKSCFAIFFREEINLFGLTRLSSYSFHRTRSCKSATNWVAQRRSVVLLAQESYVHEKSCFAIFFREEINLFGLTRLSSYSFHRTRSCKSATNWVAQRRSVVLLAQESYVHEKSCFAIFSVRFLDSASLHSK